MRISRSSLPGLAGMGLLAGCAGVPDLTFEPQGGGVDGGSAVQDSAAFDAPVVVDASSDDVDPGGAKLDAGAPDSSPDADAGVAEAGPDADANACVPPSAPIGAACCSPTVPCLGAACQSCTACLATGCHGNQFCCIPPGGTSRDMKCSADGKTCD